MAHGRALAEPRRRAEIDSRHQQVRPSVKQVHCEEEGSSWNPIAAIVRHERGVCPASQNGGMRFRFSALRLLNLSCAAQRVDDAGELHQHAVTGGLDDAARMLGDFGLD